MFFLCEPAISSVWMPAIMGRIARAAQLLLGHSKLEAPCCIWASK